MEPVYVKSRWRENLGANLGESLRTRLLGVGGVGPGVGETGSGVGGLGAGVGGPILRRILWAQFA